MPPPISSTSPLAPAIRFLLISARPASSLAFAEAVVREREEPAAKTHRSLLDRRSESTPRGTRPPGAFASSFGERSVLGDQPVLDGEHAGADALIRPPGPGTAPRTCRSSSSRPAITSVGASTDDHLSVTEVVVARRPEETDSQSLCPSGIQAKGWSIYGAEGAQPAATGRTSSRENGSNKPIPSPPSAH